MPDTKAVDIDDIVLDERCQPRDILNSEAVDEYEELYRDDRELPPLTVFQVGEDFVLADGFHRLAALRRAGKGFCRVEVHHGDIHDCIWFAAKANQGHGVRRTNADKRQAVRIALASDFAADLSLRDIAAHVGVSHMTVDRVKKELSQSDSEPDEAPDPPESQLGDPDEGEDKPEEDIYHTAARRILGCYKKVCAILGEGDDVCEQLYVALEKAKEREV